MCKVQKTIVNRVKGLCKERNLSYYMLAHQSGIPSTTMFHLVDGTTQSTRITTIVKICSGLGMTLEEFFSTPEFEELLSEVTSMCLTEFDEEKFRQMMREEGREEGIALTKRANAQNLIGLLPDEVIAEKIGLPLEEVQKMHE